MQLDAALYMKHVHICTACVRQADSEQHALLDAELARFNLLTCLKEADIFPPPCEGCTFLCKNAKSGMSSMQLKSAGSLMNLCKAPR